MQPAPHATPRRPRPAALALMAAVALVIVAGAAFLAPDTGGADDVVADHTAHAAGSGPAAAGADHGDHGDHGTDLAAESTSDEAPVPDGPVISLDDPRLTDEQRAAAKALIERTRAALAVYTDEESIRAAGYVSIGDGVTGWEHFIHLGHLTDGNILDPERVESIVMQVHPDGTKDVVSAMYILPPDHTMDDVPDVAGPLTVWHDHQDLCWEGIRVVGTTGPDGSCARGEFRGTPPMLHVWLVEHPCGPFAGIEGSHGDGCAHHDH